MPACLLLDTLVAQVQLQARQRDGIKRVHHRGVLGDLLGSGGLVAAEPGHGDDVDAVPECWCLVGQPGLERDGRTSGDQVEQPDPAGALLIGFFAVSSGDGAGWVVTRLAVRWSSADR